MYQNKLNRTHRNIIMKTIESRNVKTNTLRGGYRCTSTWLTGNLYCFSHCRWRAFCSHKELFWWCIGQWFICYWLTPWGLHVRCELFIIDQSSLYTRLARVPIKRWNTFQATDFLSFSGQYSRLCVSFTSHILPEHCSTWFQATD